MTDFIEQENTNGSGVDFENVCELEETISSQIIEDISGVVLEPTTDATSSQIIEDISGVVLEPVIELPREECIKVQEEKTLFVTDDIYKSVETFKQQIPNLPEYVYWILFLRYNKHIISEEETRFAEETISKLRNAMKEENAYYQKLFEDNKSNTIDCSPTPEPFMDIPAENELTNIGFN